MGDVIKSFLKINKVRVESKVKTVKGDVQNFVCDAIIFNFQNACQFILILDEVI